MTVAILKILHILKIMLIKMTYKVWRSLKDFLWGWWVLQSHNTYSQTIFIVNMSSSVGRQDELNAALWLATQASKISLSRLPDVTQCTLQENNVLLPYDKSFADWACSVETAWYGFMDLDSGYLCPYTVYTPYPAIWTSCLGNNPYCYTLNSLTLFWLVESSQWIFKISACDIITAD